MSNERKEKITRYCASKHGGGVYESTWEGRQILKIRYSRSNVSPKTYFTSK